MAESAKGASREPHIWSSVIRSLRSPLIELDQDPDALMRASGISRRDVEMTNGEIPLKGWMRFMELAAERAEDPLMGIKLARSAGPQTLGAIGFLFLSSRNILDALENFAHYLNLLQGVTNAQVIRDGVETSWVYQIMHVNELECRQDIEFSMTLLKRLIKIFAEEQVEIIAVNFRHSPIADRREYERQIKVPVYFNQDVNSVVVPATAERIPGRVLDPALGPILKGFLDEELEMFSRIKSLADQVRHTLYGNRLVPPLTARKVARHIGMSEATFYRRLKSDGVRFSDLLDERNAGLAMEYLTNSDMKITQIAHLIGFSDSASFSRAFTRWSDGETPSAFRRSRKNRSPS